MLEVTRYIREPDGKGSYIIGGALSGRTQWGKFPPKKRRIWFPMLRLRWGKAPSPLSIGLMYIHKKKIACATLPVWAYFRLNLGQAACDASFLEICPVANTAPKDTHFGSRYGGTN